VSADTARRTFSAAEPGDPETGFEQEMGVEVSGLEPPASTLRRDLEAIRELLDAMPGVRARDAKLLLVSEGCFDRRLRDAASSRDDVVLLTVEDIFAP